jgi:agmatine deiminase
MPTPRELGFAMPPAWVRQQRHWLAWPTAGWQGGLDGAREAMAGLVQMLAEHRGVSVLANPEEAADVSLMCGPGVGAVAIPHGASGLRAMGPSFLLHDGGREVAGIVWPSEGYDDVAGAIIEQQRLRRFDGPLPRAGAMVDVDGEGTALASEALLAGGDRHDVERILHDYLRVEQVIWVNGAIDGDMSGGTVLNAARYLKPGLAIVTVESDGSEPDAARLEENRRRIEGARDARGRAIATVLVPLPKPRARPDGSRIAMSYANCFIDGSLVILPAFEDGRDDVAYDRVVQAVLDHTVVSYPAFEFAQGGCGLGSLIVSQPAPAEAG